MRFGFEVSIKKGNQKRTFIIEEEKINIGNSYINNVPIQVDFDTLVLLELQDGIIKLYLNKNLKIELIKSNERTSLENILKFVTINKFIQIKKDIEVIVYIGEYELSFKVVEIPDKHIINVPKMFHEDIITKDNISFLSLLMALTFFAFFGLFNIMKNVPEITNNLYNEIYELGYQRREKTDNIKLPTRKSPIGSGKNIEVIDSKGHGKAGTAGGFFEGEAVISKGILAINEGTKNVLIEREKSLFSKIDETIQTKPIKGYKELTNIPGQTFNTPRKFDTAKIDMFGEERGSTNNTKQIELEKPEKLKSDLYTKNVQVIKGKRPELEIISVIGRHKKGFEFLYIEERKKDYSLQGKLVLKIEITSKGVISNVEVLDTDIQNKEFIQKIIFLVKSIRFSEADYGDTVVKIPLVFLPS